MDAHMYTLQHKHISLSPSLSPSLFPSLSLSLPPPQFAAHQLNKDARQWEDNDMVAAAKRMAKLMMQMAKFTR